MIMEYQEIRWKSPSNIALIKYWGKREFQLPMNPSISLSLNRSFTDTTLKYRKKEENSHGLSFEFYFDGKRNISFECKIRNWLDKIHPFLTILDDYELIVNSSNNFPHSSGIASSASSFSSLALCFCSMESDLTSRISGFDDFEKKASFLARLGSGSAARSIFGNYVVWGKNNLTENSSDEYASQLDIPVHENFMDLCDSILIVNSKSKSISSSVGHQMMVNNPYAVIRYQQAKDNFASLLVALQLGDIDNFIQIIESEALTLHAMFLTSSPGFILANSGTVEMIERIRSFRKRTGLFLCFTLDSGPNVHLIYPKYIKPNVHSFIKYELENLCENNFWIDDEMGKGPVRV